MSQDVVIQSSYRVPDGSAIASKPCYLVTLVPQGMKSSAKSLFIALELPDMLANCIKARGFFVEKEDTEIIANYKQIVQETDKENYAEMYFPWHTVRHIRSLVFKAK